MKRLLQVPGSFPRVPGSRLQLPGSCPRVRVPPPGSDFRLPGRMVSPASEEMEIFLNIRKTALTRRDPLKSKRKRWQYPKSKTSKFTNYQGGRTHYDYPSPSSYHSVELSTDHLVCPRNEEPDEYPLARASRASHPGGTPVRGGADELDQVSRDPRSWPTLTKSGTTTMARPQKIKMGMRHKAGMGMRKPQEHMAYIRCKSTGKYREQSKSCFSRRGKQRKPGTWVITPTPAPSKPVLVVVLPRKAEYGLSEKQNISGSQGTPGPYESPRSKEETQGSPNDFGSQGLRKNLRVPIWPQGLKEKIEARTPVQPRAHRGNYNFKELPGSKHRSPDPNLRVPTRPQRPNTIFEKRADPCAA
ncbi:hypothetical protein DY000_02021833 [Brassica cretica]|uniref:Uncharacterized protein n=1 Tax=Brassica cretica TaxID=69181 RepID=A0ABQ7E077_BRACR|nr:hypothetical protein DY000_02021833 [Brassica cretica]